MLELSSTQDLQDILSSLLGEVPRGPWVELQLSPLRDTRNGSTETIVRVRFPPWEIGTEHGGSTRAGFFVQNRFSIPDAALIALDKKQFQESMRESITRALVEMQSHIWLYDPRIGSSYGNLPKCPWFDPETPSKVIRCPVCQKPYGADVKREDLVWASAPIGWVHRECMR